MTLKMSENPNSADALFSLHQEFVSFSPPIINSCCHKMFKYTVTYSCVAADLPIFLFWNLCHLFCRKVFSASLRIPQLNCFLPLSLSCSFGNEFVSILSNGVSVSVLQVCYIYDKYTKKNTFFSPLRFIQCKKRCLSCSSWTGPVVAKLITVLC